MPPRPIRSWLRTFALHPAPLVDTPEPAADLPDYPDTSNALDATAVLPRHSDCLPSDTAPDAAAAHEKSPSQDAHLSPLQHPAHAHHVDDADPFGDGTSSLPGDIVPRPEGLQRKLSQFHIQMIAFGGSIGTGLYVGSGSVYAQGGPGFLILDYCLIGSMLYCVVMCLGELAVVFPVSGSFSTYSTRFISPAWGFAMGWNYWMQWLVTLPLELVAATIIIQYWDKDRHVSPGVWVIACWAVIAIINIFGVRGYGDFEVFGSVIKILMTLGFIVAGIVITAGGAPNHDAVGLRYWNHNGAFLNGFKGFCSVLVSAAFSFSGTEMIGITAAETKNPRRAVPKASRQVFMRILLFYVGSLFIITLNIGPHEPDLINADGKNYDPNNSPFVLVIKHAQIYALPSVVNAVILISALSVGNTSVYGASRTLVALAQNGQAPRWFAYVDREGRPMPAVALSLVFGFLAFLVYSTSAGDVFNWLVALSGLAVIFSWGTVCICHMRFRAAWRAAGRSAELVPWRSPVGIVGAIYGLLVNVLVLVFQAIIAAAPIGANNATPSERTVTFFQAYLAAPVVIVFLIFGELDWDAVFRSPWCIRHAGPIPICYGPRRFWLRSWVRLEEIDIDTGRRDAPSLEQLRAERQAFRSMPLWKKLLDFFF